MRWNLQFHRCSELFNESHATHTRKTFPSNRARSEKFPSSSVIKFSNQQIELGHTCLGCYISYAVITFIGTVNPKKIWMHATHIKGERPIREMCMQHSIKLNCWEGNLIVLCNLLFITFTRMAYARNFGTLCKMAGEKRTNIISYKIMIWRFEHNFCSINFTSFSK